MIVSAFDPGVTTGYALATFDERYDGNVVPFRLIDAKPVIMIEELHLLVDQEDDVRIVEDFVGAGHRTPEAIHTLKLVGYLQHTPNHAGIVVVQSPQRRKAFVSKAIELINDKGLAPSKHAADALAHILYYKYTLEE